MRARKFKIIRCRKNAAQLVLLSCSSLPSGCKFAKYFLAIGLFSAGITSAITAPLASAYVVKGCFNWKDGLKFTVEWYKEYFSKNSLARQDGFKEQEKFN